MNLTIPELSLVVLIGASGSGKSTFAARHFLPTEIVSSDRCRALVSDDQTSLEATKDAFDLLHYTAGKRLARGRLTVVDATNVQPQARQPLVELARSYHALPVAIVLDLPERLCQERNRGRPERDFGPHVIHQQHQQLQRSLKKLKDEGFRTIHVLSTPEEVEAAAILRQPLWSNRRYEHGPFDIIGDVHGCYDELQELLGALGYEFAETPAGPAAGHPEGRKLIVLGDIADRGPGIAAALRLVMNSVAAATALCVPGNHDLKLMRALRGRKVNIAHGLQDSLDQLAAEPPEFRTQVADFVDGLVSHYVLDDGKLVVAHAGMKAEMQGRGSRAVREFALYGETTGETDEFGLPVRVNWAADYRGAATVVYGHAPVPVAEWQNRTLNIDTGCVFGGRLTALRYPEKELVSVPARREYYAPARPLGAPEASTQKGARPEGLLDITDVLGKRRITTRWQRSITVQEEQACAALEVMSRFALDPRWLIYLPPTMSPSETSALPDLLEHPAEALDYYRRRGVPAVICEEKHMGSRAVVVVCRDDDATRRRFRCEPAEIGACYTRTGRAFFSDAALERAFLEQVRLALTAAGFWQEFGSDWFCLDCELMPWSAKAQELLREQYAAVGVAARLALEEAAGVLASAGERHPEARALAQGYAQRLAMTSAFAEAYRRYCWPVSGLSDLRLAPFHLLASEGVVHRDKDHRWHMETLARLSEASGLLLATPYREVDLNDAESVAAVERWWEELTARGGEGMVVKPLSFIARGARGLVQPAIKCRGREYLRLIYGPEYTARLDQLRHRSLTAKRSLALREFTLGLEALERFVAREPLYHVHECVFAILALESEPVDPRL